MQIGRKQNAANDVLIKNCTFQGEEDGESALKEAKNVKLENCLMALRYPLWHDENVELCDVTMTDTCRAALWYTDGLTVQNSRFLECQNASLVSRTLFSIVTFSTYWNEYFP